QSGHVPHAHGSARSASAGGMHHGAISMERNLSGQSSPPSAPLLIPAGAGDAFNFGTYDVHWKIDGSQTGRRFSVIHQLVAPRALVAPLPRHHREDEYSYVLTGRFGALLGDAVVTAEPGTWVCKPRGIRSGMRATLRAKSSKLFRLPVL